MVGESGNAPAGFSNVTAVKAQGLDGDDGFAVTPNSAVSITLEGGTGGDTVVVVNGPGAQRTNTDPFTGYYVFNAPLQPVYFSGMDSYNP